MEHTSRIDVEVRYDDDSRERWRITDRAADGLACASCGSAAGYMIAIGRAYRLVRAGVFEQHGSQLFWHYRCVAAERSA